MKIYFLAIPIAIGILIGVGLVGNLEQDSSNPSVLTKENLIKGSIIMGNPNAKITIVEFGDYQCTFCYKFHDETMKKITNEYIKTNNVNFIYKDFPLNGEQSILASEASYCAQKQGKFWEYHNTLYNKWGGENTGWITENVLLGFARDVRLNLDEFSMGKTIDIEIVHADSSNEIISCNHTYNKAQIDWFRAGSALNLIRSKKI